MIRPYIACAIVRGANSSEEALKSWIGLQDKMDQTYGRKRKKASIGLYQADAIVSPLTYTVSKPEAASFVPLGSQEKMALSEILEKHPKGREYGSLISSFREWPLLVDGANKILSLPPVINSNDLGRIDTRTRNILLEVTGTNLETVHNTLKIIATTLTERGGRIYSCTQKYDFSPRKTVTPKLELQDAELSVTYTSRTLGIPLSVKEAARYLRRAGYRVERKVGDKIKVKVPSYRLDIMHQIDIVEDIAIAINLNSLTPEWPRVWTAGRLTAETDRLDTIAELMIGLGYQELITYSLTSPETLTRKMRAPANPFVELKNPKSSTLSTVRNWILPSILEFLGQNTHVEYPQRVFEIGISGIYSNGRADTVNKLAAATAHSAAGYTEVRACLDALLEGLGADFRVEAADHPSFLPGRCGAVYVGKEDVGMIGEVHPEVVTAWGLGLPVAAFELETSAFETMKTTLG